MPEHFWKETEKLKKAILSLGALVEERVQMSIKALETRDGCLAQTVVDDDKDIDQTEVDIEEECLKLLALYQPVASDLRFIITVMKVNNDIERIADLGVNIAERVLFLCSQPPIAMPFRFTEMKNMVLNMFGETLDALMHL